MPAWLLPLATAALSAGSQFFTNRQQMRFNERMASTQARRAVEDYRAAGLNPALAYDRGAAAPTTNLGDIAAPSIASAMAARQLMQELKQSKEMHQQNLRQSEENIAKTQEETRRTINERILLQHQQPGAENTANFERMLGRGGPALRNAKTAAEILKLLNRRD